MIIQPYKHYVVHCKNTEQTTLIWNLIVLPGYKSWNILGQDIQINTYFHNHLILSIKDITETTYSNQSAFINQFIDVDNEEPYEPWKEPISKDDFDFAVITSGLSFNASYGLCYRCQFCNGLVINDRCSQCMFDWDS